MTKIILTTALLSATLLNATTNKEIKLEAKSAIMKMASALGSNMKKNMKQGGAVQAAQFCTSKAQDIQKSVNASFKNGITVKRISLKLRNKANKPLADELLVLQQIQKDVDAHKTIPKMIIKEISDDKYKVYKPIFIKKNVCLSCHGLKTARNKKAYKIIKKKFPDDKAINYKIDDFRGAFVVEIKK